MPHQVAPGIYRLPIPLPDNPLGTVNAYAVTGADGVRLIDCGWNTSEAHAALAAELEAIGHQVSDLREILVTHIHPDHFGLAGRLVAESGARLLLHRLEALYVPARYEDMRALVREMEAWLRVNGVPPDELESMAFGSTMMAGRVGPRPPDVLLDGGEELVWGGYRFDVVWTPGHSGGLICLYDRASGVFISSDHVLRRTSPHVGLHAQSFGNPLGDYLSSLALVRDLPLRIVLPGHGEPFTDLAGRVDELVVHHRERCAEMLRVLDGAEQTAFSVAGRLSWRGAEDGWERLAPFQQRMAVSETIAHLEYLHGQGQVAKSFRGGVVFYRAVA